MRVILTCVQVSSTLRSSACEVKYYTDESLMTVDHLLIE